MKANEGVFIIDDFGRQMLRPRDLIDQIIDITRYRQTRPVLTKELIAEAWANYFVKL